MSGTGHRPGGADTPFVSAFPSSLATDFPSFQRQQSILPPPWPFTNASTVPGNCNWLLPAPIAACIDNRGKNADFKEPKSDAPAGGKAPLLCMGKRFWVQIEVQRSARQHAINGLGSLRLVFPSGQPGSYQREIRGEHICQHPGGSRFQLSCHFRVSR